MKFIKYIVTLIMILFIINAISPIVSANEVNGQSNNIQIIKDGIYKIKSRVGSNKYIDISAEDPLFVNKQMDNIDGDYYLAIKGLDDCFFNLYISTQDVKIMTLEKGSPAGCTCESENDNCYFRFENINNL